MGFKKLPICIFGVHQFKNLTIWHPPGPQKWAVLVMSNYLNAFQVILKSLRGFQHQCCSVTVATLEGLDATLQRAQ